MKWRNNNVRDLRKLLFGKWWSFCAGGFKPGTLAVSYIHTYALKSPYQKAHCGNCHDLIAFLILHLITHFTEETVCQTCPMRNINLVYRGEYLVSGWKICDLDLEDTHYKSPQTQNRDRTVSIRRSWFSHSLCVFEHLNDITEISPLQQATALNHRWCGWSELLESSVCLWQKVRPPPEITTFSSCDYG